jgi:NADPH-dependent glutamate synthase beta subunit-like oxidoreductase
MKMPFYDGRKFAQEGLMQVAQHCAQAALHAPQLIGKTDVRMEIVAGEELKDFFSVQDAANRLGARLSGETYKAAYQMGEPPVVLLIGADVTPIVQAPCRAACPAGIDVPRYIRLIGDGKYDQAAAVVREKVPFPSICAYVCRAPCETKCRRGTLRDRPIAIEALKRFAVDHGGNIDGQKPSAQATGKRVAVIGSGPTGLTAAYYLKKVCGHETTVFEALSQPGGMMRVGIPSYRLPRDLLDREIQGIKNAGVDIKTNTRVDSLDELFGQGYDAVLVALGTHEGQKMPLPGADLDGVLVSLDFLRDVNLGKEVKVGKRVLVLGGGDVAFDCARVARRLGADEVHLACLESKDKMPAAPEEIEQGQKEGVVIHPSRTFTRIAGEKGHVAGVESPEVESFKFDEEGQAHVRVKKGSEQILKADTVIFAMGQRPEIPVGFGLRTGRKKALEVDPQTLGAGREGVFAAGDVLVGTSSVIEAIASGRKAAASIDLYLGGLGIIDEVVAPSEQVPEVSPSQKFQEQAGGDPERPRMPLLPVEKALAGFETVELGLTEEQALLETSRCLKCDQVGFDCGGCGFKTCREAVINCQNRLNETGGEPWGWLMKGPSCIWRAMELGISIDWAAAAAHTLNVESRVAMIPAMAFMRMGYMEGCTLVTVLPLGPCRERWYFSPGTGREDYRSAEMDRRAQILQYPPLWIRFTGPGRDLGRRGINVKDRWWDPPYTRLEIVEDDKWGNGVLDRDYAIFVAADEIRKKNKIRRLNLPKIKEILDDKKQKKQS